VWSWYDRGQKLYSSVTVDHRNIQLHLHGDVVPSSSSDVQFTLDLVANDVPQSIYTLLPNKTVKRVSWMGDVVDLKLTASRYMNSTETTHMHCYLQSNSCHVPPNPVWICMQMCMKYMQYLVKYFPSRDTGTLFTPLYLLDRRHQQHQHHKFKWTNAKHCSHCATIWGKYYVPGNDSTGSGLKPIRTSYVGWMTGWY